MNVGQVSISRMAHRQAGFGINLQRHWLSTNRIQCRQLPCGRQQGSLPTRMLKSVQIVFFIGDCIVKARWSTNVGAYENEQNKELLSR